MCWSILIANARSGFVQRTGQLNISTITSQSLSQLQTFARFDGCSSAKALAGSEALRAEDAVSLNLPYSAEML